MATVRRKNGPRQATREPRARKAPVAQPSLAPSEWQIFWSLRGMSKHIREFLDRLSDYLVDPHMRDDPGEAQLLDGVLRASPQRLALAFRAAKYMPNDDALLEAAAVYSIEAIQKGKYKDALSRTLAGLAWGLVRGTVGVDWAFEEAKRCRRDDGPPDGMIALKKVARGGNTTANANRAYKLLAIGSAAVRPDSRRTPRGRLLAILDAGSDLEQRWNIVRQAAKTHRAAEPAHVTKLLKS
jgi:hypothetical protein